MSYSRHSLVGVTLMLAITACQPEDEGADELRAGTELAQQLSASGEWHPGAEQREERHRHSRAERGDPVLEPLRRGPQLVRVGDHPGEQAEDHPGEYTTNMSKALRHNILISGFALSASGEVPSSAKEISS